MIDVFAIPAIRRDLVDPLADHLDIEVSGMDGGPGIFEEITHGSDGVEAFVHFRQEKKTGIGCALGTSEINLNGAIEFGPQSLRSGGFGHLYHVVTKTHVSFGSVSLHNSPLGLIPRFCLAEL